MNQQQQPYLESLEEVKAGTSAMFNEQMYTNTLSPMNLRHEFRDISESPDKHLAVSEPTIALNVKHNLMTPILQDGSQQVS